MERDELAGNAETKSELVFQCTYCSYKSKDQNEMIKHCWGHLVNFNPDIVKDVMQCECESCKDARASLNIEVKAKEEVQSQNKDIKFNKMPEGQGKRDKVRPHYDYIPIEFDNEIASIFEEGRRPRLGMPEGYGDSWMKGGQDFLNDCLNHAFWHLKMYMRGDRSENHLAKVAWNCLAVRFHEIRDSGTKLKEK